MGVNAAECRQNPSACCGPAVPKCSPTDAWREVFFHGKEKTIKEDPSAGIFCLKSCAYRWFERFGFKMLMKMVSLVLRGSDFLMVGLLRWVGE